MIPFHILYLLSLVVVIIATYFVTTAALHYRRGRGMFNAITNWQSRTFPYATKNSMLNHLSREVAELREACMHQSEDSSTEIADCIILLYGIARRDGMDYDDLMDAIDAKMATNKKRTWGEPDAHGVVEHIR